MVAQLGTEYEGACIGDRGTDADMDMTVLSWTEGGGLWLWRTVMAVANKRHIHGHTKNKWSWPCGKGRTLESLYT